MREREREKGEGGGVKRWKREEGRGWDRSEIGREGREEGEGYGCSLLMAKDCEAVGNIDQLVTFLFLG